ncbi:MAG: metal-dependent transcriptional regulator, partial [Phycisphaerae bacterium]|nr:metal-dependent transcriptional regulator [Phycisphaerae bacterium]
DRVEEILETLWTKNVEQEQPKFSRSTFEDAEAIDELNRLGYVTFDDGEVTLSEQGLAEARNCVRRHRLAERLLIEVHETGCQFEHLLHKGLEENVCTILGHPRTCPHGRPIPPGRCCENIAKARLSKIIMPLTELEINRRARVAYLHTGDRDTLPKILAMGVLPNTDISLLQKFPSYVLQLGKSQFAVDEEVASHIYVRII